MSILDGSTTLITGASAGIGEDMARLLGDRARHLILVARSEDRLHAIADELSCETTVVAADLTRRDHVERLLETVAPHAIDVLINNAGIGLGGPFAACDEERLLSVIELNLVTLTVLSRRLLSGMLERRHGGILNVGSTVGFQGIPYLAVYAATKAFVNNLTESLAGELRGSGVRVSSLCPGTTRTAFFDAAGIDASEMLKVSMDSRTVAAAGLRAFERGRVLHIPGWINRILIQGQRLLPRIWVRSVALRIFRHLERSPG